MNVSDEFQALAAMKDIEARLFEEIAGDDQIGVYPALHQTAAR